MNSHRNKTGVISILALSQILVLSLVFAQPQQNKKAIERALQDRDANIKLLSEITFDRVVLLTLQAVENNYRVREQLFPLVHVDDYYQVILMTAKRLALAEIPKKQINPVVVKVPPKTEKKSDKKQEEN